VSFQAEQYPPVAELLPHTGRWVLVSRVLEHEPEATTCLITVGKAFPFPCERGLVPPLLGLEYMAQCIAIHGALRARGENEPRPVGLLLGARHLDLETDGFRPGQCLEVTVRRVWGDRTFYVFDCWLRDRATQAVLMSGTLKMFRSGESQGSR
jgi:predicted hotdog family 3-hydroxylacyl-ACP dehydratase